MSFVIEPYVLKTTTTSAQIVWVMPEGTDAGSVQIEKQAGGGLQEIDAEVTTPEFVNDPGTAQILYHVRQVAYIDFLEPYTRYNYTINAGDGETVSTGSFITMRESSDNGPVSFVISADGHGGTGGGTTGYDDTVPFISALNPDFVAHLGDFVGGSGEFYRWPGFFRESQPYLSISSLIDAKGGHDHGSTSRNYESLFTHNDPNGPPVTGNNPVYYSVRHGNVEIFIYDYTADTATQHAWLEQVVPASDARWKILGTHGQVNNPAGGLGSTFESPVIAQLCIDLGIDVAVQGHWHVIEETVPIGAPGVKPVFFYTINPAEKSRSTRPSPISIVNATRWSFLHIAVDGDTMTLTHRKRDHNEYWNQTIVTKDEFGMYQEEIMNQAIGLDTAIQIAHIWTGNSFAVATVRRGNREDIHCKLAEMPTEGQPVVIEFDTGARRNNGGWPIGSKLIIEEQNDPVGWQSTYQELEVTGETTQGVIIAPSSFTYDEEGGFDPQLELQVNFELPEEE